MLDEYNDQKMTMGRKKGQISLEAGIVLLYILVLLVTLWLGGPVEQATTRSTDTNGILLASEALNTIGTNVDLLGFSGDGARKDFVVHVPFNTVDIRYGNGSSTYYCGGSVKRGAHINFTVLLYTNVTNLTDQKAYPYYVEGSGDPSWHEHNEGGPYNTSFFYINITRPINFEIDKDYFPFCKDDPKIRKPAYVTRGNTTRFVFLEGSTVDDITFCCEAGFNLNVYVEKSPVNNSRMAIRSRQYYSLPGEWNLNP